MTTVDVRLCMESSGGYGPLTACAAIHTQIKGLAPGQTVTLGPLIDARGVERDRRYLQTRVLEITPPGWRLVTRGQSGNTISVTRVK